MKLILDVFSNHKKNSQNNTLNAQKHNRTPIWFMRQAGRYLPEYMEVRKKAGSFLNLCYTPEYAAEVTLQPLQRFDIDAAIIFSDILVVPHSLGLKLEFIDNEGPSLENIYPEYNLSNLNISTNNWQFEAVFDAISSVKSKLPKEKTLIGFAGAPWTLLAYMLGYPKVNVDDIRKICYKNHNFVMNVINILVEQICNLINIHITAGAEVIQIFDSWSGSVPNNLFLDYVINPTAKIVSRIKSTHPNIPIIGFPRGCGNWYEEYVIKTGVNGISVDQGVSMDHAKHLQSIAVVQGNLDPSILFCDNTSTIEDTVQNIMSSLSSNQSFIFNLGHGILQHTPIDNLQCVVNSIRKYDKLMQIQATSRTEEVKLVEQK